MDLTDNQRRAADQMVVVMARRMQRLRKVQVGVNAPIAESAALLAKEIAGPSLTVHCGAMSGVHHLPSTASLFMSEWDAIGGGASFPLETVIDLMSGREGIDDEPVHPLQVDASGHLNLSGIAGEHGRFRLMGPGPAGTDVLPYLPGKELTLYVPRHSRRTLVGAVSIATAPMPAKLGASEQMGFRHLVTDKCVLQLGYNGWSLQSLHSWVQVDDVLRESGFPIDVPSSVTITPLPTPDELGILSRIDPHKLRELEFLPSESRRARALHVWRTEIEDRVGKGLVP